MLARVSSWLYDLVESGKQAITTTHSLEAVKIIAGVSDKSKIILSSLEDGVLISREMQVEEVEKLEEEGIDVRIGEGLLL